MSCSYTEYNLDELGFLGRGKSKHRPRNDPALYGGDYPFVQTGDVKAVNLHIHEYSETYNETGLAQSKLWDKGTLLITIAANIAETAVLDMKACFPDSVVGFVPDQDKVNVYFIKYYIDYIKREMQNISQGTTQDNLSLDKLRLFKFKVPDDRGFVDQISNVILNYDHLIENNNRRITILEEMAQSLYKEWFVHFRFPGHEQAKFVNSSFGQVPEDWKVKEFGSFIDFWNGKKGAKVEAGEYPLFGANGVIGLSQDWKYEHAVIIGRVGAYCGAVECSLEKFWGSDNTIIAKCKTDSNLTYLFLLLQSFKLNKYAGGSAQPLLTQTTLKKLEFIQPPAEVIEAFEDIASKNMLMVKKLQRANANLKLQRDMLLPKLISGQIQL